MNENYIASIGMEVHAELNTRSKMFCRCPAAFAGEPNTRTCPVCLGLPGALPVPNREAIEMVLRTALALNCTIAMRSIFHRKNYFYPDLPKGYQISQYGETNPLGYNGWLPIPTPSGLKKIRIRRVHLEEDTGKLMHMPSGGSGIDYNRSSLPLMEIVTEFPPDIADEEEAKEYLVQLRSVLVWLGVCDGKMEEGSLRCEPNISVRKIGSETYGTKTELKNLNSFRSVQLGVRFEAARQSAALEAGEKILQETRGWNEAGDFSFPMRIKEAENDYRYFPDPDLVPMEFTEEYIESLRASLPELPLSRRQRYQRDMGLSAEHAERLISDRETAEYFEETVELGADPQAACNWIIADFAALLNDTGRTPRQSHVTPAHLLDLTQLIADGRISGKMAKEVFAESFASGKQPSAVVEEKGLVQVQDSGAIREACQTVLDENPEVLARYRAGQMGVKGFLVGQAMKRGAGKFNPQIVQQEMQALLDGLA